MPYYFNPTNQGLINANSNGDGYGIFLKWTPAYASNKSNKIAYHIYMSETEENVFSEGVKFVSVDGTTSVDIYDLTPGQLYFFAVRAVEYNSTLFNISQLPRTFNNLAVYPETILIQNITSSSLIIQGLDVETFPTSGVFQLGYELINYSSLNLINNRFNLTNTSQRGFFNSIPRSHNTDGYDGYHILFPPIIKFSLGREELNTRIFPCQNGFEYPNYQYTDTDGYHQTTKDLLTTDLAGSDAFNQSFPTYDYAGWHRTNPVDLLTGVCVGSYIGGEMFCADGYSGVGRVVRGMSLQDQNNQRQEVLLNLTGEPVCLIKRVLTGITCSCYTPGQEYPDDRCPKCFPPGTLVRTETGLRPIEEIKIGDKVLSSDGLYYKVVNRHKNKYEGYLKSITTSTTTNPILSTPEHPFMTLKGDHYGKTKIGCGPNSNCKFIINQGNENKRNLDIRQLPSGKWHARIRNQDHKRKALGSFLTRDEAVEAIKNYKKENFIPSHILQWEDAENIKNKDWLVSKWNKNIMDLDTIKIPQEFLKNTKLGTQRNGAIEFLVDEEFMWIIGIYLAEGCKGTRSICFALHKEEIEYQNKIVSFFKKYGYNSKINQIKDGYGVCVEVYSTTLSRWFPSLLGDGCENKNIPEILMNLPNNKTIELIKGAFNGDGSKRDFELVQTSEILALQIAELLHRNGEQPLVRMINNPTLTPKGNERKTAYGVSYKKPNLKRDNRKGRWNLNNELLSRVKNVEDVYYSGNVYNLEVEGDHTYIVQNILVHNCHGKKFVMGYQQFFNPRRSDGRILIRFSPTDDDLVMNEAGLESTFTADCWTLTVPTVKDRDIIVRFDQDGNEEFRYEILSVNRNKTLVDLQGGQKFRVQRIRKFDPTYQIRIFRNTQFLPQKLNTSISSVPGIAPHTHEIVINEQIVSLSQINQTTSVSAGHSHDVINGIVQERLGHSHNIIIV